MWRLFWFIVVHSNNEYFVYSPSISQMSTHTICTQFFFISTNCVILIIPCSIESDVTCLGHHNRTYWVYSHRILYILGRTNKKITTFCNIIYIAYQLSQISRLKRKKNGGNILSATRNTKAPANLSS